MANEFIVKNGVITPDVELLGSTSGSTTIVPAATASGSLTLPAATDTLVGKATTDTLTNKTIDAGSNTISGLTNANLSGSAGITNANLANSTITINGSAISLGGSVSSLAVTIGKLSQFASTTSAELAGVISDETGSGALVFATSPTLVTPTLGVATATSINKVTITAPATGSTLTIADGKTLTASNTLTFTGTDASSVAFGAGGTVVYTSNKLSVHAATTSAELAGVISDETGSGSLVFATSPTLVTPNLGTPSAVTLTNATGLPVSTGISGLGTGVATFLATPSSANLAAALTDETGTGTVVFSVSPTFTGTANFAAISTTGNASVGGDLTVTGNVTVNGTTTTINSTTISVDDKNIELGSVATPTNTTADGGGITLKGATDKTLNWVNATSAWTSSEDFNLLTGKVYEINGTTVLSATGLGSGVVSSSLTSVGTIGTGTWQGTVIGSTYGGTGINNGGRTITLNTGNLTITAQAAGSSVTIPASGTLISSADTGTVTSTMIADGTIVNADINASAAISVSKLAASTISGVTLGNNLNSLTAGTGLSGTAYNGSAAQTWTLAASGVSAASYGSASAVPVITVDTYGRITSASTSNITKNVTVGTRTSPVTFSVSSGSFTVARRSGSTTVSVTL